MSYKVFFKKLLIFSIIVLSVDFLIGKCLRLLYFNETNGLHARTTYNLEKSREDVIILGSSRANHHYDSRILEEKFHLSSYNGGRDGNFLLFNIAQAKIILSRYTPKIIIIDLKIDDLFWNSQELDRLSSLLPYYRKNLIIKDIIFMRGWTERIKLLSNIYPFNSEIVTIAAGNFEFNRKRNNNNDIRGFVPLNSVINDTLSIYNYELKDLDFVKIKLLQTLLKECKQKKVKVCLVTSPYFLKIGNSTLFENTIHNYFGNVKYISFLNDARFNDRKLFADKFHLNNRGSSLFTNILVDSLRNLMINKK